MTLGLDVKSNNPYNLHEAVFNFLYMRQGQQESDDSFNNLFDTNLQTLDLGGGRHILCSKNIIDKVVDDTVDKEVKK